MPGITLAGRGAVHYARITLQDCGYEIERITGSRRRFRSHRVEKRDSPLPCNPDRESPGNLRIFF